VQTIFSTISISSSLDSDLDISIICWWELSHLSLLGWLHSFFHRSDSQHTFPSDGVWVELVISFFNLSFCRIPSCVSTASKSYRFVSLLNKIQRYLFYFSTHIWPCPSCILAQYVSNLLIFQGFWSICAS